VSEVSSGRIFLSYRREDTRHIAGRLFDRLVGRFGAGNVFMDVDSIEPGLDFGEAIESAVGGCDVLLALIGGLWLGSADEQGRRRLDDPDDLVVLEVKTALERQVRVIPVLVDGAAAPRRHELPDVLAPLARRNGVRLDHETFSTDLSTLMTALDRALPNAVPSTASNTITATIPIGQDPQGVALAPDGRHAYITNSGSNSVSVIDIAG
jgi:DNA-binding beta-propeller fold protein YncE